MIKYQIRVYFQCRQSKCFNLDKVGKMYPKELTELKERFSIAYPESEGYTVKIFQVETNSSEV